MGHLALDLAGLRCGQVLVLSFWKSSHQFVFQAIRDSLVVQHPGFRQQSRFEETPQRFRPEPLLEHQDSTSLTVQKGKERKK